MSVVVIDDSVVLTICIDILQGVLLHMTLAVNTADTCHMCARAHSDLWCSRPHKIGDHQCQRGGQSSRMVVRLSENYEITLVLFITLAFTGVEL